MPKTAEPRTRSSRKETATSFLRMAATGQARRAFEAYVDPSFRHHNAYFPGDGPSLAKAMDENARQNPEKSIEFIHVIEDGELVAVYSRVRHSADSGEAAVVHIFRFEGDRVVELWDVGQEVPEDSPNQYGMF